MLYLSKISNGSTEQQFNFHADRCEVHISLALAVGSSMSIKNKIQIFNSVLKPEEKHHHHYPPPTQLLHDPM